MPVSRNRKQPKKKKTKKGSNRTDGSFERVTIDGIEFTRDGKMTYIRNRRSAGQHARFLKQIEEGHPVLKKSIDDITETVLGIFNKYDKIKLLGGLAGNLLAMDGDGADDGMSEVIVETGQNLATSTGAAMAKPSPPSKVLNQLIDLLKERQERLLAYYNNESILYKQQHPDANHLATDLRQSVIIERLTIRGIGYYDHVEEVFLELFEPHNEQIQKHWGFTVQEFIETLHSFERAIAYRRSSMPGRPNIGVMRLFDQWAHASGIFPPVPNRVNVERFRKAYPEVTGTNGLLAFYDLGNILTLDLLYEIKPLSAIQTSVAKALSIKFGDNEAYLSSDDPGYALNDSLVNIKPFIEDNGRFFVFNLNQPSRNFLRIGQHLLKEADPKYYEQHYLGKKYQHSRDNYLERKVTHIFGGFMPDVMFYPNVSYPIPGDETGKHTTELDLLGVSDAATYLIEVKAGELNDDARKGGLGNLVSRLKKNVGEGASQSHRAAIHIHSGNGTFRDQKKTDIVIDPKKKIYRIVITLDNFAGTLTKLSVLEGNDVIRPVDDHPWVVNLYDLMIFSEILQSQQDFNDFLDKRLALNNWEAFNSHDEVYFLGHFLDSDLEFDEERKKLDFFSLDNHNQDIDAYYYAKQRGLPAEKPLRKKNINPAHENINGVLNF